MDSKIFKDSRTFWEQQIAEKILRMVRDELYLELRFLNSAFSAFVYQPNKSLRTLAADGETLFYSTEQLFRVFENNPAYLNRLYLHSVLHCLFSHLWLGGKRNPYRWGIACDIAVEYTIDHMDKKCTRRISGLKRTETYKELEASGKGISAAVVYRYLYEKTNEELQGYYQEFFADDHVFWPKQEDLKEKQALLSAKWERLKRQTQMERKRRGNEPEDGEESLSCQMKAEKSRRNYRDFLKRFMVYREELKIDLDEFDIGFYTYGLRLYRNMPLLEAMETRETKKIQDFVVVVDTSDSTSGKLVQNFLKETFHLLTEQNHFFRFCKLHLIQADEKVQSDILLAGERDIEELFHNFEIKGGGSTDFRPAFRYVDELLGQGAFDRLCGLLYFTDGKGIYPEKKPAYKTAFLFLEEFEEEKVPPWAIRIQLEPEEFLI